MRPSLVALGSLALLGAAPETTLESCASIATDGERLACYDRLAGRAPGDAPPAPATPIPAAAPAAAEFGKPRTATPEPERLEARIRGSFRSWEPGALIPLDNGQVWKVSAGERGYYPAIPDDAEIVITRGLLGSYWLEVKAVGRRIKVRRVS